MTLSQIRRHLVDRASTTQQEWPYRQAPAWGGGLAALAPRLHQLYMWWLSSPPDQEQGGGVCSSSSSSPAVAVLPFLVVGAWAVRIVGMLTVYALARAVFAQLAHAELVYARRAKYSKFFAVRVGSVDIVD